MRIPAKESKGLEDKPEDQMSDEEYQEYLKDKSEDEKRQARDA